MGKDTQQLKDEIAARRDDLGYTMDAIEDKVHPGKMVQRRKYAVRQSISNVSDKVMGNIEFAKDAATHSVDDVEGMAKRQAQGSPLLAGAVAAGLGFLASVAFPGTKTEANAVQQLTDKAQPVIDQAKEDGSEIASAVREKGMESAQELKESATEHARQAKASAQESVQSAKDVARQKGREVAEDTKSRTPNS